MNDHQRPSIYQFKDPVTFLEKIFQYSKEKDPELSVRKWAKDLGVGSSDLLMGILKRKKKISMALIAPISKALQLDSSEMSYFEILVKLTNESSLKERWVLESILAEVKPLSGTVVNVEDQSVFSHWVHMAILSLSRLKGVNCRKENIKNFLMDDVPQDIIDDAIERLIRLGLLSQGENGVLEKNYDHTTSKNDAFSASPHPYFLQTSELAKRGALENAEEREFQCFSLPIRHEQIPEFKQMLRGFRAKVANFASKDPDQVYQFNFQFFPLTKQAETIEQDLMMGKNTVKDLNPDM